MKNKQFCVYTSLFGKYEKLNEQNVAIDSNIDFICFTDDENIESKTWKLKKVQPIFPYDNIRSSRTIKICPHRYLEEYDVSLYIDNSVKLKVVPETIFNEQFTLNDQIISIKHSFRETVLDEFEEVIKLQYDKPNVIIEQLNAYSLIDPNMFSETPYWTGFLIRSHNNLKLITAMEDWLSQVLRYSRRDQLSFNYIIRKYDLPIKKLNFDNAESIYHKWPTSTRYGTPSIKSQIFTSLENNLRLKVLENKIQQLEETIEEMELLIQEREKNVQTLSSQLDEKDQTIQSLNAQLADKDQAIQSLNAQLTDKDQSIQSLNAQLDKKEQSIQSLNTQLAESQNEVLYYALSKSWIVTRPLRKIGKFFKN